MKIVKMGCIDFAFLDFLPVHGELDGATGYVVGAYQTSGFGGVFRDFGQHPRGVFLNRGCSGRGEPPFSTIEHGGTWAALGGVSAEMCVPNLEAGHLPVPPGWCTD